MLANKSLAKGGDISNRVSTAFLKSEDDAPFSCVIVGSLSIVLYLYYNFLLFERLVDDWNIIPSKHVEHASEIHGQNGACESNDIVGHAKIWSWQANQERFGVDICSIFQTNHCCANVKSMRCVRVMLVYLYKGEIKVERQVCC